MNKTSDDDISSLLSVVIPAFNEADGIGPTLVGLQRFLPEAEIIVVDDSSNDETASEASREGVVVLQHDFNRGYGGALKTGMLRATRRYIAWFDADNEHRPENLRRMVEVLEKKKLAAVIGRRTHPGKSALRHFGKLAIRLMARTLSVEMGKDVNCGLRVFRASAIVPYLGIFPDGYSASLTSTMILIERGYPIEFYRVDLNPRIGVSKVRLQDGFVALTLVLRIVMLFAPLRIFLRGGLLLLLAGLGYGIGAAFAMGRGIPIGANVLMLSGVLFCFLGLIADQISQMRLNQLSRQFVVETKGNSPNDYR